MQSLTWAVLGIFLYRRRPRTMIPYIEGEGSQRFQCLLCVRRSPTISAACFESNPRPPGFRHRPLPRV